jgi:8-oxo-dGTP diphosphatase
VAALVRDGQGRVLLSQRRADQSLPLCWEFPGGKIEPGETPEQAIAREVREELGVAATPHEALETVAHDYPHGLHVEIVFVRCTLDSFRFTLGAEVHAVRWQPPAETALDDVLEADRGFLRALGAGNAAQLEGDSGS